MKIRINRKFCDSNPHFPIINQGNEDKTKMCCTIYAPFISLNWNSNIISKLWLQTEEEVELILDKTIDKQVDLWLLSLTKWWYWSDWIKAIERDFKANVIELNKWQDKELIKELLSKWLALTFWINVDIDFITDSADWELDWNWHNYIDDDKKYWHFTTIVWANPDVINFEWWYKYAIVDSYAWNKKGRDWVYKFNDIDWFLDFISMKTIYLIW